MTSALFNTLSPQVVLQEVPGEVSLLFTISGCQLNCDGCHSTEIHDATYGTSLTPELFIEQLEKYNNMISCVLFFGGEWQKEKLITLLKIAKEKQLKTCLYTGKNKLPQTLLQQLDFVKYGKWKPELGGLDQPNTNQRFIDLLSGNLLNKAFIR